MHGSCFPYNGDDYAICRDAEEHDGRVQRGKNDIMSGDKWRSGNVVSVHPENTLALASSY